MRTSRTALPSVAGGYAFNHFSVCLGGQGRFPIRAAVPFMAVQGKVDVLFFLASHLSSKNDMDDMSLSRLCHIWSEMCFT